VFAGVESVILIKLSPVTLTEAEFPRAFRLIGVEFRLIGVKPVVVASVPVLGSVIFVGDGVFKTKELPPASCKLLAPFKRLWAIVAAIAF
jgi:hypothetical protein